MAYTAITTADLTAAIAAVRAYRADPMLPTAAAAALALAKLDGTWVEVDGVEYSSRGVILSERPVADGPCEIPF
jgi:hypothetical protein